MIVPRSDIIKPFFIIQIPLHCLLNSLLELEGRLPAEFLLKFGGVDSVAGIVTETVCDIGDKVKVLTLLTPKLAVNGFDESLNDVNILPLIEAADVISLGDCTFMENQKELIIYNFFVSIYYF